MLDKAKLCYIDENFAYFTTQDLKEQWGDDWDDSPFQHNAGSPSYYYDGDKKAGKAPWEIIKIAFDADLVPPHEGVDGSSYSVEQINAGVVPWLRSWDNNGVKIMAGASLRQFIKLIDEAKGKVYIRMDQKELFN